MDTRDISAGALVLLIATSTSLTAASWNRLDSQTTTDLTAVVNGGAGTWVVVGRTNTILVSADGLKWTQAQGDFGSGGDFFSVTYGNGMFVAGGSLGVLTCTSPDGTNWTTQASANAGQRISGLAFGNGRFVAVGEANGYSYLITSTNGTNWSYPGNPASHPLYAVTYWDDFYTPGRFVAVGADGTIIVSTNGLNWTLQSSGTRNTLRAVCPLYGFHFVAAGDSATVLASHDGFSWWVAAQPSFDVKALAYGGAEGFAGVAAAGDYKSDGRIQSSSDGATWPGYADAVPQPLNAIAFGRWLNSAVAVGNHGLIVITGPYTESIVNSWTNSVDGRWHDAYWSRGELPGFANEQVAFTNDRSKTLAITADTASYHFGAFTMKHLVIDAPSGSRNTLLLDHSGVAARLNVLDRLLIGTNGSLVSYGSACAAKNLDVNSFAMFAEEGQSEFVNVNVTGQNGAELVLSNGWFSVASTLQIGTQINGIGSSGPGTFRQYGGSNRVFYFNIRDNGFYEIHDGNLYTEGPHGNAGSISLRSVRNGAARLNIAGGLVQSPRIDIGDLWGINDGPAVEVWLSGGSIEAAQISISRGFLDQSGGLGSFDYLTVGGSNGQYRLSAGELWTTYSAIGAGTFVQSGGLHSISEDLYVYGSALNRELQQVPYQLIDGTLESARLAVQGGLFVQSGGANRTDLLDLQWGGAFTLQNGELYASDVVAGGMYSFDYPLGLLTNDGGALVVENTLSLTNAGVCELKSGIISARRIVIGHLSTLLLRGGSLQSNQRFIFADGTLQPEGSWQLGVLILNSGASLSTISLTSGVPATVRFQDSRAVSWGSDLAIRNWSGNTNGGGTQRIYVGSNAQGLTAAQVRRISFINPTGLAEGAYTARILSTGELVPALKPSIKLVTSPTSMVLTWPPGYQLMTATNVQGPYSVATSSSPYTSLFTDPQRFFYLQSP